MVERWPPTFFLLVPPCFCELFPKDRIGMAITPTYEAFKALASLSIGEEFCQKIGYAGEIASVYEQLYRHFSLMTG